MELSLKTSIDSSKDDLDSDLDHCRVLVMKNGSEEIKMETIMNKLKKIQKKGKPQSNEVRVQHEKENFKDTEEIMANAPKGKPGKSGQILDDQIKENEQALFRLLEQAHKCVESSESSEENFEVEMPKYKSDQRKVKYSRKNKLK